MSTETVTVTVTPVETQVNDKQAKSSAKTPADKAKPSAKTPADKAKSSAKTPADKAKPSAKTPADKAKPSAKTPADKAKSSAKTPADKAKPSAKTPADKAKPSAKTPADKAKPSAKTPADKQAIIPIIANRLSAKKYPALIGRKFSGIGCIGDIGNTFPSRFYGKVEFTIKNENGILSAVKTHSAKMPPFPYLGQVPPADRKSPFRGDGQFLTKKHLNAGETDFSAAILAYEITK